MLIDLLTALALALAAADHQAAQRLHRQIAALIGPLGADLVACQLELERLERGARVA